MALKAIKSFYLRNQNVNTTQHIRCIETLDNEQYDLLLRQNLSGYEYANEEENVCDELNSKMSISSRCSTKPL